MSISLTLLKLIRNTGLDGRIRRWSVRMFGKEVARYTGRELPGAAARAFDRAAADLMFLVIANDIARLLKLHRRLFNRFPDILAKVEQGTFTEMVALVLRRGERDFKSLRGLLVEYLARHLPEVADLGRALDEVRRAANRVTPGWKAPRLVTGVTDGASKALGDLTYICEHADGRVWVMAIIESKSFSNLADLVEKGERPVGQHLWDYVRAKTTGLAIEGRVVPPGKLVIQPVPVSAWNGPGVVGPKTIEERVKQLATGKYTAFIGFAPREFTSNEVARAARQGVQIEMWRWPFDLDRYNWFQRTLVELIESGGY